MTGMESFWCWLMHWRWVWNMWCSEAVFPVSKSWFKVGSQQHSLHSALSVPDHQLVISLIFRKSPWPLGCSLFTGMRLTPLSLEQAAPCTYLEDESLVITLQTAGKGLQKFHLGLRARLPSLTDCSQAGHFGKQQQLLEAFLPAHCSKDRLLSRFVGCFEFSASQTPPAPAFQTMQVPDGFSR